MNAGRAKCDYCGKPFRPRRPWARFCHEPRDDGRTCHDLWWARERKRAMGLLRAMEVEMVRD